MGKKKVINLEMIDPCSMASYEKRPCAKSACIHTPNNKKKKGVGAECGSAVSNRTVGYKFSLVILTEARHQNCYLHKTERKKIARDRAK